MPPPPADRPTESTPAPDGYAGQLLGLPAAGPGSLAPFGRRLLGIFIDWLVADDRDHSLIVFLRHGELGDPTVLVAGIRIVPATRQGATTGFRIDGLSASEPLAWLGFASGDTLHALDGKPLTSPDQVLQIFTALVAPPRVLEVGVIRRGRHGILRFRVR